MVSSIAIIFLAIIYCSPAYKCITFTEEEMEIDAEQYDSFYRCQAAGDTIRNASAKNVTLLGVPTRSITNDDVSFLLYTRNNSKVPQILRTSDSIEEIHQSFIDFSKQTILGVHAAWSTYLKDGKFYPKILLPKYDINIIQTNWDSYSFYDIMYLRNMVTPQLGNIVAEFLSHLIAAGANPKKIHLMGYSTGGQAVGLAAKKITPKIARITAFDPQGSCFNFLPSTQRLSESDADYVEIVHCTVGEHAMPLNLTGNVTIYINGGLLQPQCTSFSDAKLASTCSHSMCGVYSHLSLLENDKLLAIKCPSYLHYLQSDCDCSDFVTFGYNISTSVNGLYFLDTSPMAIRKLCPDQNT